MGRVRGGRDTRGHMLAFTQTSSELYFIQDGGAEIRPVLVF